jgi:tetratricopeptide (TPR) repeat protein
LRPIGVIILIALLVALIYSQRETFLQGLADEVKKELDLPEPATPEVLGELSGQLDKLAREGDRLLESGKSMEAEQAFLEVIRIDSTASWAYANVAAIRANAGDLEGAIENWRQASEKAPEDTGHRINLGKAYAQAGRSGEALAVWETVMGIDPFNATANELIEKERATFFAAPSGSSRE